MSDDKLLAADEPAPVRVLRAERRVGPVPHRRSRWPGDPAHVSAASAYRRAELTRHIAWDIGIRGVTERLSAAFDATAVFQTYSRLVIDCNRAPGVPSSIPEISEHTPIPGNVGLTQTAKDARVAAIFTPVPRSHQQPARRPRRSRPPHRLHRDAQLHADVQG